MKKHEEWMGAGEPVMALGRPGVITKLELHTVNDHDYVTRIHVKLDKNKKTVVCMPRSVEPIKDYDNEA